MKKGPLAESQVVQYLQTRGFSRAERRVQGGTRDRGDVAGIPGLVIEVKNEQRLTPAEWVDEAHRESHRWHELAVVWHKRRGKTSPGDWYVTMTGETFTAFLRAWQLHIGHAGKLYDEVIIGPSFDPDGPGYETARAPREETA